MTKSNLSDLNGVYSIVQVGYDSINKKYNRSTWVYQNFLKEIDRNLLKDTLQLDSLKYYDFELKVLNESELKIKYLENDQVFRERTLKTKLKKDGYLYLKNKNIGFVLVPYIAGAIDVKKGRLGLTDNGTLLFDYAHHRSGALMIIAFLDGRTWKGRLAYELLGQ